MAIVLALLTVSDLAFAQRRGGGGRGGGGMRGGGFRGGGFSGRASARPTINRPAHRPSYNRPSARPDVGRRPSQLPSNINRGDRGRINTGDRVNRIGDNTVINRDVNIDGDNGRWDWNDNGCCWGAGAGIIAGAAITAAAIGTTVYALPPDCGTVYVNSISYYNCGGAWYEPHFVGTTVEYEVVEPPDDD